MRCLIALLLAEHKCTPCASASGTYSICVWTAYRVLWVCALCPWINACSYVSICLHAHFSVCSPLHPSRFFYVLKAILRVTFQKPCRAALLSLCARLCDSVWVEKAQGHISGPLPITELHSLQMILWWGESGGIVVERKWPGERKTVGQTNTWTPMRMVYIYI